MNQRSGFLPNKTRALGDVESAVALGGMMPQRVVGLGEGLGHVKLESCLGKDICYLRSICKAERMKSHSR